MNKLLCRLFAILVSRCATTEHKIVGEEQKNEIEKRATEQKLKEVKRIMVCRERRR